LQQVQKIRRKFRRIFLCPEASRNLPNCSAIIAKAIIAHSSKMGKELRQPAPLIIDILALIPVAAQQVLGGVFYTPVC